MFYRLRLPHFLESNGSWILGDLPAWNVTNVELKRIDILTSQSITQIERLYCYDQNIESDK